MGSIKSEDFDGVMSVYVPDDTLFVFDVIPGVRAVGISIAAEKRMPRPA
jgi:hypothetical protein